MTVLKNQNKYNLTAQDNDGIYCQKRLSRVLSFICACYSKNFMCVLYLHIRVIRGNNKLLSKIPIDLKSISEEDIDKEILRAAIIAELDAVNLYEQMANLTKDANIKAVLMDVAKEEKTHIGEFQALLLKFDPQQKKELDAGAEEVEEISSK